MKCSVASPPGCWLAMMSQALRPIARPLTEPAIMPAADRRDQNIASEMGMTAEPINTPMKLYTQPRLI